MLTRAKHKQGEGTLKMYNPKVGRASRRKKMAEEDKCDEQEKNFHMVFLSHVRNGRTNVWRLREEDEEEREEKGSTCR
jgi:hypothetical protein